MLLAGIALQLDPNTMTASSGHLLGRNFPTEIKYD